jgi:low temperature requirement protein LtrA
MPPTSRWGFRADLLRPADRERGERVAFVELFLDLVFVFALTQVGAVVAKVDSPESALHAVIVLIAVWWVWMHTTWVTNWLDPQRLPVRLAVIVLAGAGLLVSTSIVESLGERALAFALAYVGLHLARTLFMIAAASRHDASVATDFVRILGWFVASGALWIGGALLGAALGPLPLLTAWTAAVIIDLAGPAVSFVVPRLGRGRLEGWDLSAHHFAERASLFVIIAIGEGFLVSGFAFVENESSLERNAAMASAFVAAAAMWWLYFDHGEWWGEKRMSADARAGAIARAAYAYAHIPIIAGIVLVGAADKTVIAHPDERTAVAVATVLGGPALFLLGNALFRRIVGAPGLAVALGGALACAALIPVAALIEPWMLSLLSSLVLASAAAVDTVLRLRRGGRSRG